MTAPSITLGKKGITGENKKASPSGRRTPLKIKLPLLRGRDGFLLLAEDCGNQDPQNNVFDYPIEEPL